MKQLSTLQELHKGFLQGAKEKLTPNSKTNKFLSFAYVNTLKNYHFNPKCFSSLFFFVSSY